LFKKNILKKTNNSIDSAQKISYIIGMEKNNAKKIPRTHKFHPKMLDLIKKCAEELKVRNPFTFIEIAVINEAERLDIIRPSDVKKYCHSWKVKI